MRALPFDAEFASVYSFFTSFGYYGDDENEQVLAGIARALKPGGRFLIEMLNRDWLLTHPQQLVWTQREDGSFLMEETIIELAESRVVTRQTLIDPTGGPKVNKEYALRAYTCAELTSLLRRHGLKVIATWGGIQREPYSTEPPPRSSASASHERRAGDVLRRLGELCVPDARARHVAVAAEGPNAAAAHRAPRRSAAPQVGREGRRARRRAPASRSSCPAASGATRRAAPCIACTSGCARPWSAAALKWGRLPEPPPASRPARDRLGRARSACCSSTSGRAGLASNPIFLAGTMHWNGEDFVLRQCFARATTGGRLLRPRCTSTRTARPARHVQRQDVRRADVAHQRALRARREAATARVTSTCCASRRRWKHELPNCRLQTLERRICGRPVRVGDVDGSEVPGSTTTGLKSGVRGRSRRSSITT